MKCPGSITCTLKLNRIPSSKQRSRAAYPSCLYKMASSPDKAETSESFMNRMAECFNSGFVMIGVAIGSSTGLFETMAAIDEPKTSQEIADIAGLKERYVREWLAVMVTSKIVDMDFDKQTYLIPKHRAEVLTKFKGPENLSLAATTIPALCAVYDDIIECFKRSGPRGVPYSKYSAFMDYMGQLSAEKYQEKLPHFVKTNKEIHSLLESGITVVDIGCGHGMFVCTMAREFPNSQFYGVDFCDEYLQVARKEASKRALTNVTFEAHDVVKLPADWSSKFDYVTAIDTIHDQAYPDVVLKEVYKLVKPGGYFSMIDVNASSNIRENMDHPMGPCYYATSLMHCMSVSLYFENGMGLGAMWGKEKAKEMVEKVGFRCVQLEPQPDDLENYHALFEKPDSAK
ncbi:S-adenosylmethionine-dependent methyltransferase Rv2258c-like [Ptychodera flava]|uniref:S-adenosylmethionine-dependent methyltransferase Rv2258c-like n=1 Tax=Ptychodera flava TaxID=63121 RepID=UPI00396A509A